ncbi:helix-turn-helix domain-containing protein [Ferroplasma acidiphilum]|uniref:helix-turn-helix domain-containing protein n=1 Tax=Ferroplasma acidiphilum TaxID=74969 RepID=UPI00281512D0|nr:helix-turn-helix domain-containing protein [Ferroplasma acidiphilum]WMT53222.1 MAG: helix-turn-helix domain-containing protein [Ferroplasma acidiphilum]
MDISEKIAGEITISDTPGVTIKKWREEFGISQMELSKFMDVSPSVISDYESGRRKSPGANSIKKIVDALVKIDESRGGHLVRRYNSGIPSDALLDIKDYDHDIELRYILTKIRGTPCSTADLKRNIRGYTMIDGIKAVLKFSYAEYTKLYGWSSQRIIFITDVSIGRSPMIAIRAHPLKPAAVVYVKPDNVDELAIKLSEIENIPLIKTDMDHKSISAVMNSLR